ncbi:MAG: hypothetical protein GWP08_07195 [Nitrospiraceae bacterium]|nr:hypothetical protein [Nitrospiraceae bacterium]
MARGGAEALRALLYAAAAGAQRSSLAKVRADQDAGNGGPPCADLLGEQIQEFWKHTVWLHGSNKNSYRSDPVFQTSSEIPLNLRLYINEVSGWGNNSVRILVDGTPAAWLAPPNGASHLELEAAIPAGAHTVQVENTGDDWLRIENYAIGGAGLNVLRPIGLAGSDAAYLWVYDVGSQYGSTNNGFITGATFSVFDLAPGDYRIEYYRTRMPGGIFDTENVSSIDGTLTGHLPNFTGDIAVKVMPAQSPPRRCPLRSGGQKDSSAALRCSVAHCCCASKVRNEEFGNRDRRPTGSRHRLTGRVSRHDIALRKETHDG